MANNPPMSRVLYPHAYFTLRFRSFRPMMSQGDSYTPDKWRLDSRSCSSWCKLLNSSTFLPLFISFFVHEGHIKLHSSSRLSLGWEWERRCSGGTLVPHQHIDGRCFILVEIVLWNKWFRDERARGFRPLDGHMILNFDQSPPHTISTRIVAHHLH